MRELSNEELQERARYTDKERGGIHPLFETFYIRSILYCAKRSKDAFERFDFARNSKSAEEEQVSAIHEGLGHAASLSRFFWPSGIGNKKSIVLSSLKKARALKLKKAFSLTDNSPLKTRSLRDALEHFDERLDIFLLEDHSGYFFPDPLISREELANTPDAHFFKMVDPASCCFILLGERYYFQELRKEIYRIYDSALEKDKNGGRL